MSKDNIILYFEWNDLFEDSELTEEEQKDLVFAAFQYGQTGVNPTFSDRALKSVWSTMRKRIDHDFAKYDEMCVTNRRNGRKGGRPKNNESETVNEKPENRAVNLGFSKKPKKPDMDMDTDMDIDMDIESESNIYNINNIQGLSPSGPSLDDCKVYFTERGYKSDPEAFYSYYAASDWNRKGDPIRDWHALAMSWEKRESKFQKSHPPDNRTRVPPALQYSQRSDTYADLEQILLDG